MNKIKQVVPVLFKLENKEPFEEITKKIEDTVNSYIDSSPDYYLAINAAIFAYMLKDINTEDAKKIIIDFSQRVFFCKNILNSPSKEIN